MATKKKITDKVDKRRRAKVVVGYDASGEPVIRYASGRTVKELEANKQELIRSYVGGREVQRDILASTYILEWYKTTRQPYVSPATDAGYRTALERRIFPSMGDKRMAAVTSLDLQKTINATIGLSKTTITYVRSILKNAFRAAYAEGIIDRDISVSLKTPAPARPSHRRALTDAETAAVLSVIKKHPDGLMLALLYYTGMRRGEMLGLTWSDIDYGTRTIHIKRDIDYITNSPGEVKTACSIRDVPLPAELEQLLRAQPIKGMSYVIQGERTGEHLPKSTYLRKWVGLMAAVYQEDNSIEHVLLRTRRKGKPEITGSVLTAHFFRHNYASILYHAGVDVLTAQKYLGHADPSTTLKIYTHLAKQREDNDRKKIFALFHTAQASGHPDF